MDKREFGARIAILRRTRGLSQADLAAATGLHPTTITRIERAEQSVSLAQAYALAEALGLTLPKLLEGQDPPRRYRLSHPVRQCCPFCGAEALLDGVITVANYQQSGGERLTQIRLVSQTTTHSCPGPAPVQTEEGDRP